jgi:putative ABC transport system permease protein
MDHLLRDLRTAFRSLRRRPGFAVVVVFTLALGIGANTAVFSVLQGVLLKPLPFSDPERLVRMYQTWEDTETGERQYAFGYLSGPAYIDYRAQTEIFDGVAAFYSYREMGSDLTGGDRPERVVRMPVSSEFFDVLGVPLARGRSFSLQEERAEVALAIISHGLWQRHFAAAEDVLGRTLTLDGVAHEVIGVAPRGLQGPMGRPVEVWTPENLDLGASRNNRGNNYLSAVARLAPGVTIAQARARMEVITRAISEDYSDEGAWLAQIVPLHEDRVGESTATLWVLMAAVALVLLSTCVNVANLFLVRSMSRGRELAVRAALGSGRGGLIRQLLSESMLLALLGGVLGLGLAWGGIRALVALAPDGIPRLSEIGLNGPVLLFTLAASLLTGLVFGLAPTLRLSRPDLAGDLRDGDRGSTGGREHNRLRSALVVSEVAVALVLLVGAGVLIRSFEALQSVDLAIEPEGLLTYEVHLPSLRYPEGEDRVRFYEELSRVATTTGAFPEWMERRSRAIGTGRTCAWWLEITSRPWGSISSAADFSETRIGPTRNPSASSTRSFGTGISPARTPLGRPSTPPALLGRSSGWWRASPMIPRAPSHLRPTSTTTSMLGTETGP